MSQLMFEECSKIQFTHHNLQILIAASAHALLHFTDQLICQMNLSLRYFGKMQTTTFQLGTMQEESVSGLGCYCAGGAAAAGCGCCCHDDDHLLTVC